MKKLANLFKTRNNRKTVDVLSDAVLDAVVNAMRNGSGARSVILHPSTRGISVSYDANDEGMEKWYLFVEDTIYMSIKDRPSNAAEVMTLAILEYMGKNE